MDFEAMPRLRIEVESMKHTIIHHIGAHNSDLGEALSAEIQTALDSYDWQGQVTRIVHDALNDAVQSYFSYGDGHRSVLDAVNEGFNAVLRK